MVRTPVKAPVRTPVTKPSISSPSSDSDLIQRLRAKLKGVDPAEPLPIIDCPTTASPEHKLKGLGKLFLESKESRFKVTEEELEDYVQATAYGEDPEWDDLTAELEASSCAFFAQEVLRGPAEYGGRFFVSEHHEEWDELVHKHDRLCVLAPRDHGKTFFYDFAYPIWKAKTKPGSIGFIFSATAPQAERILEDIKEELESNPKLQYLVPSKKDKWSSRYIKLSNDSRIYARGFGTKVRGAHPDWIIVDDGLNDETIYSETTRSKQIDYFLTAISNMVIPGGQIIVVGTPFHKMDLYGELRENEEYHFQKYQAWADEKSGIPLWPERYNKERLEAKKREIGGIRFTREFMCEPVADDMSLFPSYLFKGEPIEQYSVKLGMARKWWDEHVGVDVFMGVDFAMSSSVQADYTVVWTMGLDKKGNRWIMDIQRERGLPYQSQLSLINEVARKYEPGLIFLEDNQMQRIFGDELIRTSDLPIRKFTTGIQKHSLEKGVPSLRVLLENHKFRIPRGDKRSVELTNIWIDEMQSFTWNEGKLQSVGGHDDTVMGCWICDQAVRQGGFKFTFGDEYGDESMDDLLAELMGESKDESLENEDAEEAGGEPKKAHPPANLVGAGLPLGAPLPGGIPFK